MKQYLNNTIIKYKNEYINSLFYIQQGIVLETKTNKEYKDHSYLFIEYIYKDAYSISDYVTKTKVVGYWIEFKELDTSFIKIISSILNKTLIHNELLSITDPLIKISRYLYYEYYIKQTPSFYIISIKELSSHLNVPTKTISEILQYLIDKEIISKQNKLINILKIKNLEELSFLQDNS